MDVSPARVLGAAQMHWADRHTIDVLGVPSATLMERAGRQAAAAIEREFDNLHLTRVAVVCGRGNNGGDGFVVATALREQRVPVRAFLVGAKSTVKGDARLMLDGLVAAGVEVTEICSAEDWERQRADVMSAGVIVDALVGTGLNAPLGGLDAAVVSDINASQRQVVAIDLPSGLFADSSEIPGPAIRASLTVTLAATKLALVTPPAETLAGRLVVADIGIPLSVIDAAPGPRVSLITREAMRPLIRPRRLDSHKGDYGHVVIVAGSRGKTGAAALAAWAALRSGAGLVTVAAPASCVPVIASLGAEFMTEPLPETSDGTIARAALDRVLALDADVLAVGPGLGQAGETTEFVRALVAAVSKPLVLDADALNALAADGLALGRHSADVVVTPHPGEMSRLTGLSVAAIQADRVSAARDFAATHRVHVVLKGARTVIAAPDGSTFINRTGNPGMATAGTGDVLTGMTAAWLGQLKDPLASCQLAVYLHGAAGDLAAAEEGEVALIAGDIVSRLGAAVLALGTPEP